MPARSEFYGTLQPDVANTDRGLEQACRQSTFRENVNLIVGLWKIEEP